MYFRVFDTNKLLQIGTTPKKFVPISHFPINIWKCLFPNFFGIGFFFFFFWSLFSVTVDKWQKLFNNNIQTEIGTKVPSAPPLGLWGGDRAWRQVTKANDFISHAYVMELPWTPLNDGVWKVPAFLTHPSAGRTVYPNNTGTDVSMLLTSPDLALCSISSSGCSFYILNNKPTDSKSRIFLSSVSQSSKLSNLRGGGCKNPRDL